MNREETTIAIVEGGRGVARTLRQEMAKPSTDVAMLQPVQGPFFTCPNCGKESTTLEWDTMTTMRANRKSRRAFKSIAHQSNQTLWYRCPKCGQIATNKSVHRREF